VRAASPSWGRHPQTFTNSDISSWSARVDQFDLDQCTGAAFVIDITVLKGGGLDAANRIQSP
jgi:hypothetical protein